MTTEDEVMRLLRRADPDRGGDHAPTVNGTDYLAALTTRSTNVTLLAEPTPTRTGQRRRWPIVAAAAAAVVAIGIGALLLADRGDGGLRVPAGTTVAPGTSTADEAVILGFMDAYAANDAERALTYLTDDTLAFVYGSADVLRRELAWNEAARFKVIINNCERLDGIGTDGTTMRCGYDVNAVGSDVTGLGPFGGASMTLTARDGKIVAQGPGENIGDDFFSEAWRPFASWIRAEHPADVPVMWTDASQSLYTRATTDEALRLWEQRTGEYIQADLTGR